MKQTIIIIFAFLLIIGSVFGADKPINHYNSQNKFQGRSVPQNKGWKFYDNKGSYQYRLTPNNIGSFNRYDKYNRYQGKQR